MKIKGFLFLIPLALVAIPGHTEDTERYRANAKSSAWHLALDELCTQGHAKIDRRGDYAEWRENLAHQIPSDYRHLMQTWIDEGVEQAAHRYKGRKPPKAVCAYIDESMNFERTRAAGAISKVQAPDTVYRCKVDGVTLFADKKYKSIPCEPLVPPGLSNVRKK